MTKVTIPKNDNDKQMDLFNLQWRDLNNRLTTFLLSGHSIVQDEVKKKCRELDNLDYNSRVTFINENWGPIMVQRVDQLLRQLDILETNMKSLQKSI